MKRFLQILSVVILFAAAAVLACVLFYQDERFYIAIAFACLLAVVSIFLCERIARDKDLSLQYGWFGLLGIVGVIVVALMPRGKSAAEILTEHRQLLEMGLITSERFEQKKANLLQR